MPASNDLLGPHIGPSTNSSMLGILLGLKDASKPNSPWAPDFFLTKTTATLTEGGYDQGVEYLNSRDKVTPGEGTDELYQKILKLSIQARESPNHSVQKQARKELKKFPRQAIEQVCPETLTVLANSNRDSVKSGKTSRGESSQQASGIDIAHQNRSPKTTRYSSFQR